ncbi:ABC transporter, ATP-binding protein [Bifidobacterium actinocoloniiforme DSM 22766]|uniref:ABC transporter, ATP-binding protein n=1 Tax=Bifidobacterium actinocoloniiforme DSM 22766 TaxID=1437605 RepID=A0A086Z1T4_9BIFI|nr:ABC transporter ATP-binding protein [Bifidobacterium actinocoloniiforme]AKV55592.1 hypothetical protein AB656_04565 [Bifidobacterium actinocoloniiforme DSM 22766]KFI40484.1 ABC transporter, ATP-binding protein [Bifidobacterium actinocoloniiforme DSM 22766]
MLDLRNASFTYSGQEQPALDRVSLKSPAGQALVVTGKSGCGKTTLSRVINGLIPELYEGGLEGECLVDCLSTGSTPISQLSRRVGSVFQDPKTQFFTTDVTSELAFPLENAGVDRASIRARLDQVADLFGIRRFLDRSMFALSGGEKQLVAIASACMPGPKLLLLDEPSSNLDARAIESLGRVLAMLKERGMTMVIIEHRLYYLRDLADRFVVMDQGRVSHEFEPGQMAALDAPARERLGLRALTLPTAGPDAAAPAVPPDDAPAHTLRIHDLSYTYHGADRAALRVDDLEMDGRDVIGIVGRNGAGKSTFAKALTGLITGAKGARVSLDGRRLGRKDLTRASFLVFQDVNYQLFSESVAKELRLGAVGVDQARVEEVAARLGLTDLLDRNPNPLSGGQKQRVAVGCAVLSGKRIVIMDEPTSGLDLTHMNEVTESIGYLRSLGAIVLVISHDREFLLKTCTRFLTFEEGAITTDTKDLPDSRLGESSPADCKP